MLAQNNYEPAADGLLATFAAQLLDGLTDAIGVVVQDTSGATAVQSPANADAGHWLPSLPIEPRQRVARVPASEGRAELCYELPLRCAPTAPLIGRLIIRFSGEDAGRYNRSLEKERDTVDCIARQLAIRGELSSALLANAQNDADLEFLTQCDALMAGRQIEPAIHGLLKRLAAHLDCRMTAVMLPSMGLSMIWPPDHLEDKKRRAATLPALGKLFVSVRDSRRVVVSDDAHLADALATSTGRGAYVLCSPIADTQSNVSGLLAFSRNVPFSRDELRLARALCVKIDAALRAGVAKRAPGADRATVIERIDRDLKQDGAASRAFLFIDIDRLHIINDRFGHSAGDAAIVFVRDIIGRFARPRDVVGSLSGDLLGLYLCNADERQAVATAELILKAVGQAPLVESDGKHFLSVSIGIALIPAHAVNGAHAVSIAETASRSAKSRGTGQCVVFRDLDASIMERRNDLSEIGNLQSALIDDRFVLHAQEIRAIGATGPARKFELLTRMVDHDGSLIPPHRFLSAAERYKMMPAVDRWVVTQALRQLAHTENPLEINLSRFAINISGQSLSDPGFSQFVVDRVADSGLSPDSLCFEITESAAVRRLDAALQFIRAMHRIGCSVALDDFGTGYCSFAYLQDMPVDFIKIDGMFVRSALDSPLSEAIVRAVVGISKVIGAATIAEFVENEQVLEHLALLQVDFAQGFGIGRPEPLADVLNRMETPLELGLTDSIRVTQVFEVDSATG